MIHPTTPPLSSNPTNAVPTSHVHSPCVRLCVLDKHRMCVGCHRSMDEITRWSRCDEAEKRAIVAASLKRRVQSATN